LIDEVFDMIARSDELLEPEQSAFSHPPHIVHDAYGQAVGVILPYGDYQVMLRSLAAHADWKALPSYLQDAIDNMLADKALAEKGASRPLRELLAEVGESPD